MGGQMLVFGGWGYQAHSSVAQELGGVITMWEKQSIISGKLTVEGEMCGSTQGSCCAYFCSLVHLPLTALIGTLTDVTCRCDHLSQLQIWVGLGGQWKEHGLGQPSVFHLVLL